MNGYLCNHTNNQEFVVNSLYYLYFILQNSTDTKLYGAFIEL
jgi:hypothetical protein